MQNIGSMCAERIETFYSPHRFIYEKGNIFTTGALAKFLFL